MGKESKTSDQFLHPSGLKRADNRYLNGEVNNFECTGTST